MRCNRWSKTVQTEAVSELVQDESKKHWRRKLLPASTVASMFLLWRSISQQNRKVVWTKVITVLFDEIRVSHILIINKLMKDLITAKINEVYHLSPKEFCEAAFDDAMGIGRIQWCWQFLTNPCAFVARTTHASLWFVFIFQLNRTNSHLTKSQSPP